MQWDLKRIIFAVALLVGILAYQGAVPFVAVPTLGQALWLGGFAESLAREGLFSTHSIFIGYPSGAPLAFGLAGAWPMALLIRTGMDMANAYSLVCALWLALAYWGAIGLARLYVRSISLAASAAALWLCLPIIWGHAGYSMLSMAMALLPSYFLVGYRLFTTHGLGRFARLTRGLLFVMTRCERGNGGRWSGWPPPMAWPLRCWALAGGNALVTWASRWRRSGPAACMAPRSCRSTCLATSFISRGGKPSE